MGLEGQGLARASGLGTGGRTSGPQDVGLVNTVCFSRQASKDMQGTVVWEATGGLRAG
jgi:hypothetical protein